MYQRRLKIILSGVIAAVGVLAVRLYWLQAVQGQEYVEQFEQSLELPVQWLETVRGCRGV